MSTCGRAINICRTFVDTYHIKTASLLSV